MRHEIPTPERVAEAMPDEITGEQVILALVGLGIPEDVARYASEIAIDTREVTVEVATSLRRGSVRVTIPLELAPSLNLGPSRSARPGCALLDACTLSGSQHSIKCPAHPLYVAPGPTS